ncbi:metallophosphoesterase [Bordetella genomosp. 5]|uniref:Metallophosphoesterase n=1 Tax=Bordetella genomosp. 5 TaxID=1395608 RepID=A0A261TYA6_9BORD|nr:metallophosphoesterase [Bordetella genomosp. 5]OZI53960.1 metallophosphoesterase [Bordetella genomosp. 5]
MFHTTFSLAFLYLLWRFVLPLPIARVWAALIAIALLVVSKMHWINDALYGNMWSFEVPYRVALLMGWLFCAFVLLFVFMLAGDLALLVTWVVRGKNARTRLGMWVSPAALFLAAVISAIGVANAIRVPEVRHIDLPIADLPESLDGFKLVQLSDTHISRLFPEAWVRQVVERTNNLSPDLILFTGDFIDGTVEDRRSDVAPLADLRAKYGVLGIPGNHEYYFDYVKWRQQIEEVGIKLLENAHVELPIGKAGLTIVGVTDAAATNYGFVGPDMEEAMRGAPTTWPVILMSHRPEGANESARAGVDLQLSGHTHGGMIVGLNQIGKYANQGFVSGMYEVGPMKLYVSNGIALWMGFPIRLGVPAEITEFTLRAAKPK